MGSHGRSFSVMGVLVLVGLAACAHKGASTDKTATANNDAAKKAGAYALPAAGHDELIVRLVNPGGTRDLEVSCPGATSLRAPLIMDTKHTLGIAHFQNLTANGCTLYFKGGAPAEYRTVGAGTSLDCKLESTTAVCKDGVVGSPPSYP